MLMITVVTRLDGARGKKQIWRPHVRTWDLSELNVLYWTKYTCDIVGTFWRPRNDSAPGELRSPFPPSLRPWLWCWYLACFYVTPPNSCSIAAFPLSMWILHQLNSSVLRCVLKSVYLMKIRARVEKSLGVVQCRCRSTFLDWLLFTFRRMWCCSKYEAMQAEQAAEFAR